MKRFLAFFAAVVLLCTALIPGAFASDAVQTDAYAMFDGAGILSKTEFQELSAELTALGNKYNMSIAAVTVTSLDGWDALDYADRFYDEHYGADGVLLLLAMEERDWALLAVGNGYQAVNDDAQDYLIDQVLPLLKEDRYAEAFSLYAEICDDLIVDWQNGEPYQKPFPWGIALVISLGIGLLTALIVVSVMKGRLKSVKAQAGANAYVKEGSRTLTVQQDTYLYSNVSRTPIPKSNSSGGGGGGSRGGRSGGF